jgi:hypothetical protein
MSAYFKKYVNPFQRTTTTTTTTANGSNSTIGAATASTTVTSKSNAGVRAHKQGGVGVLNGLVETLGLGFLGALLGVVGF